MKILVCGSPHHGHAGAGDRVILVRLSLAGGDPGLRVPHHGHAGAGDKLIVILVRLSLSGGNSGLRVPYHGHAGAETGSY